MNKLLIGSIALLAAGSASLAIAQVAAAPMGGHGWMAKSQTRAEVVDKVRGKFERLDVNRDGFLTQAEASTAGKMMGKRMKAMSPADHNSMFDRLDTSKDGQISRAEFAAAHQGMMARHRGDKSERGAKRMGGMGGMGGMQLGGRMFAMADADKDSRVSLAEATAAATRHFDMADINRDGTLTPEERRHMRQKMMQSMGASQAS